MGLADFDRIDIVTDEEGGGECWITVAGSGWPVPEEARLIAQFLIKTAKLERHAAHQQRPIRLELVSADEPPICVLEIAARKGIAVTVGIETRAPAKGRATGFLNMTDGWPDIDALQQANARSFARAWGLPLPPTVGALQDLDAVLAERRADEEVEDGEAPGEVFDGDLVVLAGAYAGEAIRAQVGGTWCYEPEAEHMCPIYLAAGPDGATKVNALGKVIKFLAAGEGDSVASLARAVVEMLRRRG